MKTLRERSRTTSHNTGTKPFYFHRRPVRKDWSGSARLTMLLLVVWLLSLWWAYRTFTN